MTAIAALIHNGRVLIGGDSAGSNSYQLIVRADPKVFTSGPYVFGFTGSYRMGQLLRWAFNPPQLPAEPELLTRFMSTTWINALRTCFIDGGFATKDNDQERGGVFLVGAAGRLFAIGGDYQVGESSDDYFAVGSGEDFVLGSLYATASTGMEPEARVIAALSAAEHHCAWVRCPFVLAWQPEPEASKPPRRKGVGLRAVQ